MDESKIILKTLDCDLVAAISRQSYKATYCSHTKQQPGISTDVDVDTWQEYLGLIADVPLSLSGIGCQLTTAYWIAFGRRPPAPNWVLPSKSTTVCLARPPPAPNWSASVISSSFFIHLVSGGIIFILSLSPYPNTPTIHPILHDTTTLVASNVYAEEAYWGYLIGIFSDFEYLVIPYKLFLGKRFLPNAFGAFLFNLCIEYLDLLYVLLMQWNHILLSGYLVRAFFLFDSLLLSSSKSGGITDIFDITFVVSYPYHVLP